MLFNSFAFAVFLPVVFALYWLLPHRFRWMLLLVASYWFYMSWNVKYVVLILFTTVASYGAALWMERHEDKRIKKRILAGTLVACLGVLFVFKYFNFFSATVAEAASLFGTTVHPVTLKLLLPVGISFYTFQTLGYVIDVYRGDVKAEHHFGIYATFISFFPQLVAGPIERTKNLLPQIREEHSFQYDRAMFGAKLMLWGYFKKLVIADNLSPYVDRIFDDVSAYSGFAFVIATFFFTLQIYCDFSGYSDIARGCANLLDIELMDNFKSPYFAASIRDFWSRWHISLSTWFRDYVYIPLGGNRVSAARRNINLMITFLVSGLWHGANWTFVLWGGVHGLAQILENAFSGKRERADNPPARALRTFLIFVFVAFAWVFFRAQSMADISHIFRHLFTGIGDPVQYLWRGFSDINMYKETLTGYCVVLFLPLFLFDFLSSKSGKNGIALLSKRAKPLQWALLLLIAYGVVLFAPKGIAADFVYFQF